MASPSAGPEATHLEFLRHGKFVLQRDRKTGRYVFYPRSVVRGSAQDDLEWVEATGDGTVYTTTVIRRKAEHGGDYNIAIVELSEGPRVLSRVLGISPGSVKIGLSVKARIESPSWSNASGPVVVFYPKT